MPIIGGLFKPRVKKIDVDQAAITRHVSWVVRFSDGVTLRAVRTDVDRTALHSVSVMTGTTTLLVINRKADGTPTITGHPANARVYLSLALARASKDSWPNLHKTLNEALELLPSSS